MLAIGGLLDPSTGQHLQAALAPLACPTGPDDARSGAHRRADALGELARLGLARGRPPDGGGQRPQVLVTIDLPSLLNRSGAAGPGGVGLWPGPLPVQTVRRCACDATLTRILTTHHDQPDGGDGHNGDGDLAARLQQALRQLPPQLGGAPRRIVELGRSTRVIPAWLRRALVARDGGCVIFGCDRPPGWCDVHHLVRWADGGETNLDNTGLYCKPHHRLIHEGGHEPIQDPATGRWHLVPPARGHPPPT